MGFQASDRHVSWALGLGLLLGGVAGAQMDDFTTRFQENGPRRPRGRIVWTHAKDGRFRVATHMYVPEGTPDELVRNGVARRGPADLIDLQGEEFTADGSVEADRPRGELRFLHPRLDFTGRRLMWAEGATWGPESLPGGEPSESPANSISGGGVRVHFPRPGAPCQDTGVTCSDPETAGAVMDGFPDADPRGDWLYFARFFYDDNVYGEPGWYLMKRPLETPGDDEPVTSPSGEVLRGYHPTVSPSGAYLFWVRPDPVNVGSDVWYMSLDPEGEPGELVPGEGAYTKPDRGSDPQADPSDGDDVDPIEVWNPYAFMGGKARVDRPTISPDGGWIAYASDRDGDWDLYVAEIREPERGRLELVEDQPVVPGSVRTFDPDRGLPGDVADTADDMWPSFSGDGKFLAYMSDREDGSETAAAGTSNHVWVVGVPATGGPADFHEKIPSTDGTNEGDAMWPDWDEDEDPPHLLMTLSPEGGGEPFRLELIDSDPDSSVRSDVVSMSLRIRDYAPEVPPPGSGENPLVPLLAFGEGEAEPAESLEYPTDRGQGGSLTLLFSGKREKVGPHLGFGEMKVPTGLLGVASDEAFSHRVLTSPDFDGFFTWENQRLAMRVLTRDNRWLRTGVPDELAETLYPGGQVPPPREEVRDLLPHDPRAIDPSGARPPYLPVISRSKMMDEMRPGVAWWVEEIEHGDEEANVLGVTNENAPYLLFRAPNYPPADHPGSRELYLRLVSRDLLGNRTDIRIPIWVRAKDFAVNMLQSGSRRKDY